MCPFLPGILLFLTILQNNNIVNTWITWNKRERNLGGWEFYPQNLVYLISIGIVNIIIVFNYLNPWKYG